MAAALVLGGVQVPTAFASSPYGVFYGLAEDAATFVHLPGIRVQAFADNGGGSFTPGPSTYTDATGNYALVVPGNKTYRILFTDPHANPQQVYADCCVNAAGYIEAGTPYPITSTLFVSVSPALMHRASLILMRVHRSGQWSTPLKGMVVTTAEWVAMALRPYSSDSNGAVLRGGVPSGMYFVSAADPSGMFGTLTVPTTAIPHPLAENDEWIADITLPLVRSSANIVVSKPSCNSSVKHSKKLSVSGKLSKRVTSPKTMRLDAYQWSPSASAWVLNKHASLKIKKSGKKSAYSGSIKLPHAGRWRLVAVFTGNSTYAQSGSTYKGVTVK